MKRALYYLLHVCTAILLASLAAFLLMGAVGIVIGRAGPEHSVLFRALFEAPYSPLSWGPALLFGFLLNRRLRNASASWVWIAGILWMLLWIWDAARSYYPPSCHGCSMAQSVWRDLFTVGVDSCQDECLGEFLGTGPAIATVAYSIGAWWGMRRQYEAKEISSPIGPKR